MNITNISITPQAIHTALQVKCPLLDQFISIIYAINVLENRKLLLNQTSTFDNSISHYNKNSWIIEDDFNEILRSSKQFGGNAINNTRANLFWDYINNSGLIDLGFKGSKFTWTNKRYRNRKSLILERLDRCLAN